MKRLAFNGGEITPSMALRSDMDAYARSCSKLVNFDVAATGGISRRRGMRHVDDAFPDASRLFPYIYSEHLVYLVELGHESMRVREGSDPFAVVAEFEGGETWSYGDLQRVACLQINSLLLLTSNDSPVMQLKLDADMQWSFTPYEYKTPPWQTIDTRDHPVTLTPRADGLYEIAWHEEEDPDETDPDPGDVLRASHYTERAEAFATSSELRGGNWIIIGENDAGITPSTRLGVDGHIAVTTGKVEECYVCISDWDGAHDFTQGCTSPANYKDNFMRAEDLSGFENIPAIFELDNKSNYKRGQKVKIKSGYWDLYTCIRPFKEGDYLPGKNLPAAYPAHFVRGIPVGPALPCRGTWKFYCSGTWYGTYEIRRNYDSDALSGEWDALGDSCSYIGSPENNIVTGDESGEECYLRLLLCSVRYKGGDLSAGWPADECANRLIVPSYKRHLHMRATADGYYEDVTPIRRALTSPLVTSDWSWCAMNSRYGYPALAALHETRLVLASTNLQPQTLWFSKTDDLNNFDTGKTDDAALHLTMSTATQAAICWLTSHGDVLMLGTEDAEWIITGGGNGITAETVRLANHGRVGSAHIPATVAVDRLLYCERGSGRVYQYGYSYESDSYTSSDVTVFADHIAMQGGGIVEGTILRKPYCVAVFALADGTAALMTYNTMHNVHAWHRYETEGRMESVCALPNGNESDRLFVITAREAGRKLEVIDPQSGYYDSDGLDYASTMETTAFSVPDADEQKRPASACMAHITTATPAANVTVSTAKGGYSAVNHTGTLTPGWVRLIGAAGWNERQKIGIRVTGDAPFELLAVQM